VGDAKAAVEASERVLRDGVFVRAIRPPTVPPGTSRLRAVVTAAHSEEDVAIAVAA
jgi:8-amino-7-oxononanoate synthase